MQVTRILIPTALVCWLVICVVVAQNHQDLVVRELGPRNFLDKPQTQDSPTPQASSSSSNPEPTATREEVLEELVLEREKLQTERKKVVKEKGENWKKKAQDLSNKRYKKNLAIHGMQRGLPIKPWRLPDRKHISQSLKNPNHPSLATLQQRIKQLEKERDEAQGKERFRLQKDLDLNRHQLKHDKMMEDIEAGKDPRGAAGALARPFRTKQPPKTVDSVKKEIEELEMKIKRERLFLDPAELRKLQNKVSNLRTRTLKRALERSQQSQASPSHNSKDSEKAEVEAATDLDSAVVLLPGMVENLNSNGVQMPEAGGMEAEQDWDGGHFREDFDLFLWGNQCNGQDPNGNGQNWENRD